MTYSLLPKKSLILLIVFALIFQYQGIASAAKPGWRKSILLGYGITSTDQTQTVHFADTPSPGLDNGYVGHSTLNGAILLGLALEEEFALSIKNSLAAVGLEMDYLRNKTVGGTVEPMINVSPNFDVLQYTYDIHSLLLQATAKISRQNILHKFGGYLQAGVGLAVNRLSNYQEFAPGDSTAAPMLSPYGNRNTASLALSAGIGTTFKLRPSNADISFGYRCFYTGSGRLMNTANQQTNAHFSLSPITYHLLMLSLTI